jgi:hypothetical protein
MDDPIVSNNVFSRRGGRELSQQVLGHQQQQQQARDMTLLKRLSLLLAALISISMSYKTSSVCWRPGLRADEYERERGGLMEISFYH